MIYVHEPDGGEVLARGPRVGQRWAWAIEVRERTVAVVAPNYNYSCLYRDVRSWRFHLQRRWWRPWGRTLDEAVREALVFVRLREDVRAEVASTIEAFQEVERTLGES